MSGVWGTDARGGKKSWFCWRGILRRDDLTWVGRRIWWVMLVDEGWGDVEVLEKQALVDFGGRVYLA